LLLPPKLNDPVDPPKENDGLVASPEVAGAELPKPDEPNTDLGCSLDEELLLAAVVPPKRDFAPSPDCVADPNGDFEESPEPKADEPPKAALGASPEGVEVAAPKADLEASDDEDGVGLPNDDFDISEGPKADFRGLLCVGTEPNGLGASLDLGASFEVAPNRGLGALDELAPNGLGVLPPPPNENGLGELADGCVAEAVAPKTDAGAPAASLSSFFSVAGVDDVPNGEGADDPNPPNADLVAPCVEEFPLGPNEKLDLGASLLVSGLSSFLVASLPCVGAPPKAGFAPPNSEPPPEPFNEGCVVFDPSPPKPVNAGGALPSFGFDASAGAPKGVVEPVVPAPPNKAGGTDPSLGFAASVLFILKLKRGLGAEACVFAASAAGLELSLLEAVAAGAGEAVGGADEGLSNPKLNLGGPLELAGVGAGAGLGAGCCCFSAGAALPFVAGEFPANPPRRDIKGLEAEGAGAVGAPADFGPKKPPVGGVGCEVGAGDADGFAKKFGVVDGAGADGVEAAGLEKKLFEAEAEVGVGAGADVGVA
jgi:hypothetical protein